jgi:YegS/Rv2252/BmrU family lipid kinase
VSVRNALLITNPASRRGARDLATVVAAFRKRHVEVDTVLTERQGHAADVAKELAGRYDAVFTLGGDGTAMEVLHVVGQLGRPVGVLPGGTGNLVARALGTPLNVRRAVAALLDGEERAIDLGVLADGRTFTFAAGVGIDVTMIERTSPDLKRRFGVMAYVAAGTRASLGLESFRVDATVDGERHTFHATAALVANFGTVLGGLIHHGPAIVPDDGLLDLCVFAPRSVGQAVRLGWRILRHDFGGAPDMHFLRGREIRLETTPVRMAQADGELLGPTPLSCRVIPHAARVLVARRGRRT